MDLDSSYFWETLEKEVEKATAIKMMGYDEIISDLKSALCSDFPDIPIYTFGSRIMGLARADSDLDIYLDAPGNDIYTEKPTDTMLSNQMKIAAAIRNSAEWTFLKSVDGSLPIVIARHNDSNILCDISFSAKMTVDQNKLVNYIFELQPIARYMVIYLRSWALKNGSTKFRGHIFILMVTFYLQMQHCLPYICNLQKNLSPNFGPWITDFKKLELSLEKDPIPLREVIVRGHLKDFFKYYSDFDYGRLVICPWQGRETPRNIIKSIMPLGSRRYYDLYVSYRHALIIQDMVHLNRNKAYNIQQSDLNYFKMKCKEMIMK